MKPSNQRAPRVNGFGSTGPVVHLRQLFKPFVAVLSGWLLLPAIAVDSVRTLAGAAQVPGHVDGVGALARFSDPAGLAIDAQGNVLIADSANHCLRKLTPAGIVTTIAGRPGNAGSADGPAATARFDTPSALAVAKDGTVFVSDTGNHTLRRIGRDGSVSTWAGSAGDPGATNAVGRAARFSSPLGIAIAKDGALFVADSANHAIRRVGADGAVTTFAGATEEWGATDGKAAQARFEGPVALAFGPNGSLFVSDALNHAVRRIAPDGTVSTFAGKLGDDGFADDKDAARHHAFDQPEFRPEIALQISVAIKVVLVEVRPEHRLGREVAKVLRLERTDLHDRDE